ncbi:hypothetical protein Gotur_003829 [Gossypium turneri]
MVVGSFGSSRRCLCLWA